MVHALATHAASMTSGSNLLARAVFVLAASRQLRTDRFADRCDLQPFEPCVSVRGACAHGPRSRPDRIVAASEVERDAVVSDVARLIAVCMDAVPRHWI